MTFSPLEAFSCYLPLIAYISHISLTSWQLFLFLNPNTWPPHYHNISFFWIYENQSQMWREETIIDNLLLKNVLVIAGYINILVCLTLPKFTLTIWHGLKYYVITNIYSQHQYCRYDLIWPKQYRYCQYDRDQD